MILYRRGWRGNACLIYCIIPNKENEFVDIDEYFTLLIIYSDVLHWMLEN